ncbi:hypothetical protein HGRIS_012018 [Hohenbuehelia grisea]|uniref:Zn(2)-C6 fungal-type domain-containing protein n=1 Tax=Hohenbuehelia grisea TaxID=104357 RepID=A0ABR3IP47_9AGAR
MSPMTAAKLVWDDFRHTIPPPFTTFDPSASCRFLNPHSKPQPKTKKTTKAKGKVPSFKAPAYSGEESEPTAIRRPSAQTRPEALFLPPSATRSQTADKGKKASAVVLKVPAAKTSILPFAKDMVSTMPFYACTRCLRLGLTCKWAPDCKACRGCQNGKVGCEEGASVRCFFDAPKTRRVYDTEGLTAIAGQANTTVVTRPFLLLPVLVPGHPADTAAAFHEQAEYHLSLVRSLEEQANIAWLAAYRNARLAEEHRRLDTEGFVQLRGFRGPLHLAGLPVSLPADPGHRLHSYLDRLESEQGRAWLHSIDLPDDSRGEGDVEASGAEAAGESNGDLIDE